jgi:hypothetical protein
VSGEIEEHAIIPAHFLRELFLEQSANLVDRDVFREYANVVVMMLLTKELSEAVRISDGRLKRWNSFFVVINPNYNCNISIEADHWNSPRSMNSVSVSVF